MADVLEDVVQVGGAADGLVVIGRVRLGATAGHTGGIGVVGGHIVHICVDIGLLISVQATKATDGVDGGSGILDGLAGIDGAVGNFFLESADFFNPVWLAIGEHDYNLLAAVIFRPIDDGLGVLHTVIRQGGTSRNESIDRSFQGTGPGLVHGSEILYNLGIVVLVSLLLIGIVAHDIPLITGELDDGDLAVGGLLRHVVNEGIDGCLQGRDFGDIGIELGVTGVSVRCRGLGEQPCALMLLTMFLCIPSFTTTTVVRPLVPAIGTRIVVIGAAGADGIGLHVILHRAGDVQDQDDVHGFFGGGSGGGAGGIGLQGQQELAVLTFLDGLGHDQAVLFDCAALTVDIGHASVAGALLLALGEGWQGHQRQGHDQRQHECQRPFPCFHFLIPPISFILGAGRPQLTWVLRG